MTVWHSAQEKGSLFRCPAVMSLQLSAHALAEQRWALDWDWIELGPVCSKFCWIWIGSGLQISSKFRIRAGFGLS